MTWAENLLPASFRAIEFDILSTEDEARRSLARHSYPYTDGADVEDMGMDPRQISVKAIFYGDDYETRLQEFMAALDQRDAGPLVHPVFGTMDSVQVSRYRIEHDADRPDSCTLSIDFEVSTAGAPFFDRTLASQTADAIDDCADEVEAASESALVDECDEVSELGAGGALDGLSRLSAMRQQAVSFLMNLNSEVHGVLTSITNPIGNVLGFVSDVTALTQSLIDAVPHELEYLQNLSRNTRNAINRLLPSSSGSSHNATYASAGIAETAYAALQRIDQVLPMPSLQPVLANGASAPANYAAWAAAVAAANGNAGNAASPIYPVSAAQSQADAMVLLTYIATKRAVLKARVASMVMSVEAVYPLTTPRQIEQLVTTVRAGIDDAMALARARYGLEQARSITEPLKTMALAVQESGRAIINARPPLIVRTVDAPTPLRLLAHRWYGDHSRALEIQRLNTLRSPNAITVGDKINAYAK
jgi:prophage DNA circulation protein